MSNLIFFKSKAHPPSDQWRRPLHLDTALCANFSSSNQIENLNSILTHNLTDTEDSLSFNLFDLSYSYFGTVGMLSAIISAAIAAALLNKVRTDCDF